MSKSIFDEFFNLDFSIFNRPVKDQQPYSIYKQDRGYIVVINTLGINKDDIKVEIISERGKSFPVLKVTGATQMPKIGFENSVNLGITLNMKKDIDDLVYEVRDGLTIIYLRTKEEEKETITAKYLSEPEKFDFLKIEE